jgi:diguanylate cyclase (GGDEF)-like protein/PAS domain S-box-containing protein
MMRTSPSESAADSAVSGADVYPLKRALAIWATVLSVGLLCRAALSVANVPTMAAADIAAIALIWRLSGLVNRDRLPVSWIEPAAFLAVLCALAGTVLRMHVTGNPLEAVPIVGLLLCAPAVFITPTWFVVIAGALITSWVASAYQSLSVAELAVSAGALLAATLLGRLYAASRQSRRSKELISAQQDADSAAVSLHEKARLTQALEGGQVGYWHWDLKQDKLFVSDHWAAMLGFESADIKDDPDDWFTRVHPYYLGDLRQALAAHLYGNTPQFECDYRIQHRDGTYRWALVRGTAERDENGQPIAIAGVQSDVSELVNTEARIISEALNDKLTGLPNRRAFMVRLDRAVEKMRDNSGRLFAVVFLDLDRFKIINDSMGHMVGDQLLAAVGKRLRSCQREGDLVARFGGDEFVALLDDLHTKEDAINVAKRIRDVLHQPFQIGSQEIASGGSIGIAFSHSGIEKADDMLRNADTAMYHAKTSNKGSMAIFNSEMYTRAMRLCQLQTDLSGALDRNELFVDYQPVFSLRSGLIIGAEALLRWKRGDSEIVAPADFIPVAEEMGLIESIGEWALRAGCAQSAAWLKEGLRPIKMAVNLSAKQLHGTRFDQTVERALRDFDLKPEMLELELTETALMEGLDDAQKTLARLRQSGVHVSIDDFGTGYSSLAYLRQFDFESLKIDRSFVSSLTTSDKSDAVLRGLISLAHNLDLSVTAEGVESRDQLQFLQNEGCDSIQGFVASKPINAHRFEQLLRADITLEELKHDADFGGLVLGPNGRPVSSTMNLNAAVSREDIPAVSSIIRI